MDNQANGRGAGCSGPVTVDLLADLQAGLLDDDMAAALRHRARTDPDVAGRLAALDRTRRDVAALGDDADSAPEVPAEVTARIGAALRHLPAPPTHAPQTRLRRVAAAAGVAAAVAAGGVGTAMLLRHDPPTSSGTGSTASRPGGVPLTDEQLLALLDQPADLGALSSPPRRASCLSGLGYSTGTALLGGRPLVVGGTSGVLMLLPGDAPTRVNAVVVAPNCSAVDTGLLASRVVTRP